MHRSLIRPLAAGALLTVAGALFAFRSSEAALAQNEQGRLVLFEKGSRDT